jgi:hypothetical protein
MYSAMSRDQGQAEAAPGKHAAANAAAANKHLARRPPSGRPSPWVAGRRERAGAVASMVDAGWQVMERSSLLNNFFLH